MKNTTLFLVIFLASAFNTIFAQDGTFTLQPLVCALSQPWEIEMGPDDFLWTTESIAYRVTRINPQTGATEVVLDASNLINWGYDHFPKPQSGFSGLAIHPDFMLGSPWVYLGLAIISRAATRILPIVAIKPVSADILSTFQRSG